MHLLVLKLWYILFDELKSNNEDPWRWWHNRYHNFDTSSFIRWLKNQNHNNLQNIITELKQEIIKQIQPF